MDHKKKYEEAIARLKQWDREHPNGYSIQERDEFIFPELKESNDLRIREALIEYFTIIKNSTGLNIYGVPVIDVLAWLEKQGEKKQEGRPEFRVGDWIVIDGKTLQISRIDKVLDGTFHYWFTKGTWLSSKQMKGAHLWTIQDAKDGDVLACESGWTCIFKSLNDGDTFSSYCFMDNTKWFCETGSQCHTLKEEFVKAYNGKIHPATKEQRDQLEKAMADAGYTFDFDKKELKKIEQIPANSAKTCKDEQKPAWSEEDEDMLEGIIATIRIVGCRVNNNATNCSYIDWLKSLKERYTWMPSEDQLGLLETILKMSDSHISLSEWEKIAFKNLVEHLKKLKD